MRHYLLSSVASAALGLALSAPAPASAQSGTSSGTMAPAANAPAMGDHMSSTGAMMKPGSIDTAKLIGEDVHNLAGEKVGDVNTVILDKSGQVKTVVVGVGGFLGMGEKDVAMPWSEVKMSPKGDGVIVDTTKDKLKAMPEYKFSGTAHRGSIFTE